MSNGNTNREFARRPRILIATLMGLSLVLLTTAGVCNARAKDNATKPGAAAANIQEKSSSQTKKEEKTEKKEEKGEVVEGELIEAPPPVYPEEAKKQKIEGKVTVDIVIGEEGKVISARPTSGPDLLQDAAKDAAYKARFKPTTVKGEPVKVAGALSYNFVLDHK